jgi:two-component system, NtrC family, sensor histidine kinase HydH
MKDTIRTYRIPIVVTTLMVVALAFWSWQTWEGIIEDDWERARRHAGGAFDAIEGTVRALGEKGDLSRNQIERVMDSIIRHSPVRSVTVEKDGRRLLEAGESPGPLILPSTEGERFGDGRYFIWRRVRLPGYLNRDTTPNRPTALRDPLDPGLSDNDPLMILGVDVRPNRPGYSRAIRGLLVTTCAALLFVAASLIAWIMAIRSRVLAEQLEAERSRRSYLEELGLAAAGLAHETKNPLGIILGLAQQITEHPDEPQQSRLMLEHMMDEVDKATARLGNFIHFARQRKLNVSALNAREVGARVVEILRPDFDAVGVKLALDCVSMRILADQEMLEQVLVNLLLNSLHASSPGDVVTVRMSRQGGRATIGVEDQGRGISPELLPNVFKPYVTGNPGGHGLGLAIVKRFVEEHGWKIGVESQPNRGAVFTISGVGLGEDKESEP